MKKFLVVSLLVFLAATVASASVLFTALPSGKGSWGVSGSYSQTSKFQGQSDATLNRPGVALSYGIMDNLDLYVGYSMLSSNGVKGLISALLPPIDFTTTGSQYGAELKYTILNDAKGAPVSVAVGLGTATIGTKTKWTIPALVLGPTPVDMEQTANGNTSGVGVIVSKLFIPFVPYAAVQYLMNGGDMGKSTQIDITAGTVLAFSRNWAILLEYSTQSTTPDGGGASTNNGQIAAEISYSM